MSSPPPAAAPALLEIRGARRRFGPRQALAGTDLTAYSGQLLALLGPNGAGKTTLLRAICGRTRLDAGSIRVAGGDPTSDPAVRRRLGLVPQSIALWGRLSVRSNLRILGRLAGLGRAALDEAVADALDWSGLGARARDPVNSLSGGMQRRVNIAAGTLHKPDLLLLDEPTVGLDPAARLAVHEVLRLLRRRGMGILLTTHDLHEAEELADRVAFLTAGRVCADGTVAELVAANFGDRMEVNVVLVRDPSGTDAEYLTVAGLDPTSQPRLWVGRLAGLPALGELRESLRAAGVAIAELRLRQPDLHGVFLRLTGEDPEE